MSSTIQKAEHSLIGWNLIYRLLVLVLLINGAIFLLYCFTQYTSALQWVYGDSRFAMWGAIGAQLLLTLALSVAYTKAHFYYAVVQTLQGDAESQD
ncbi:MULTISPECIES: hypothetical protein [Pseudomonas]|uniref:DUF485 domain-containing protein n=1 Tax=Pseudomonas fluorescens TaxID=294 RepID=A0A166QPX0_PSEFL|nr:MULTISPECIES: hypothetical protein [Pseudomonas]KZN20660.1 hypothetical protein A1D17_03720 [Pseudomonas fluorescens]